MEYNQITKQIIDFNKTTFDNSFSTMNMVYEQNQKMVETFLGQALWMPEAGRNAVREWMTSYQKGCNDFKKLVDDSYARVEAYFDKPEES